MRRTRAAAATVLAAGILIGGGVGVASAHGSPAHPADQHPASEQIQQQNRGPTGSGPVLPGSTAQTTVPGTPAVQHGDGTCDGTCDGMHNQVRDQVRDGTCDGTGVQQQTGAQNGVPMLEQEATHHMDAGPHHGSD